MAKSHEACSEMMSLTLETSKLFKNLLFEKGVRSRCVLVVVQVCLSCGPGVF